MSREKKIVPKLRFKEFDEKYKLKKVEDEFNLIRNYSYSRNDEGEGKYHHVHYGDIHSRYSVYIDQGVNVPSVKTTKEHIELAYGDVIVADASEDYADLGKSTILLDQGNRKYIAGLHTFALRAQDNTNPLYFVYYSKTEQYKQYMSKIGTGTSVYGITRNNLQNMKYLAPSIEEQQKIGFFFKKIDEMIQLQQSKVNKVKDIKSAYLSEMFPKEGEKYPKKRFEGFTEPWYKNKFNEITEYITSSLSANNTLIQGRYELYDANELIGYTNSSGQKQEYVTIIKDGSGVGRVRLLPKDSNFIGTMGAIVNKEQTDIHYIYAYLQQFNFTEFITGATVPHVYYRDYGESTAYHPSYEEQVKIGKLFNNLDNQISIEEEKLVKLEKLKQGYLNDMFV